MAPNDIERSAILNKGKELLPILSNIKSMTPEYITRSYKFENPPAIMSKQARVFFFKWYIQSKKIGISGPINKNSFSKYELPERMPKLLPWLNSVTKER